MGWHPLWRAPSGYKPPPPVTTPTTARHVHMPSLPPPACPRARVMALSYLQEGQISDIIERGETHAYIHTQITHTNLITEGDTHRDTHTHAYIHTGTYTHTRTTTYKRTRTLARPTPPTRPLPTAHTRPRPKQNHTYPRTNPHAHPCPIPPHIDALALAHEYIPVCRLRCGL
jgi:hypothetical protein